MLPSHPRLRRLAGALVLPALVVTCDLATQPGVADVTLTIAGDSVVAVGDAVAPSLTVAGAGSERVPLRLVSTDTFSLAVSAGGDSLIARRRDTVTVYLEVASALVPTGAPRVSRLFVVRAESVSVNRAAATLASLGDTLVLQAAAYDHQGRVLEGAAPAFASSDTSVATVTAAGTVVARRNGTATVRATLDGDTASTTVTVRQALARWTFAAPSVLLESLGDTAVVAPTARDARGAPMAAPPAAAFLSGDSTVAAVSTDGRVTASGNGSTLVRVRAGTVEDTVRVTVNQRAANVTVLGDTLVRVRSLGDVARLTARALDARNNDVGDDTPRWSSSAPVVATVNGATGVVTAVSVGRALIVARLDGVADTVAVAVTNEPARVELLPATAALASVGDTLAVTSTVRNGIGDVIPGLVPALRSSDTTVMRVVDSARAEAVGEGAALVIGTLGRTADTTAVTVTNLPVAVDLVPTAVSMASVADTVLPPIQVTNARGASLGRSSVQWTTDDPTIVSVTPGGQVIARGPGSTNVRIASLADGRKRDSVLVTVTNAPATVTLNAALDTLTALDQSLAYQAAVRNARGARLPDTSTVWRTLNPAVALVSETGVMTAVGLGTAKIVATAGAAADTADVVVVDPTLVYVDNASVVIGQRLGTLARPFARIQDAVNLASAGDTVIVKKGSRPYAETVGLSRQTTILGDSTAYVMDGKRDPSLLPTIAHDSGAAAVVARSSATQTLSYLAFRHTVEGPAVDVDGGVLRASYLHVNPAPAPSASVGAGISVRNSPGGTRILYSSIRSVRGYGVRLENTTGAAIGADTIDVVDDFPGVASGIGVWIRGGSADTVRGIVRTSAAQPIVMGSISRAAGPSVQIDSSAKSGVYLMSLLGVGPTLVGRVRITGSNDAFVKYSDIEARRTGRDPPVIGIIGRAAVEVFGSRFVRVEGDSIFDVPGTVTLSGLVRASRGSEVTVGASKLVGGANQAVADSGSNLTVIASVLSGGGNGVVSGAYDTVTMVIDTVRNQGGTCVQGRETVGGSIYVNQSWLLNCAFQSVYVRGGSGSSLTVDNTVIQTPRTSAVYASQTTTRMRGSRMSVVGPGSGGVSERDPLVYLYGPYLELIGNRVAAHDQQAGVFLGADTLIQFDSNTVSGAKEGLQFSSYVPPGLRVNMTDNELFDNATASVSAPSLSYFPLVSTTWFGDARGPRRSVASRAVGDSLYVVGYGSSLPGIWSWRTAPVFPARDTAAAAALRIVRGNGQTRTAGGLLPLWLTVRAVDASGRPKAGARVTFTVTQSDGTMFGFLTTQTLTTDASGIAEVRYFVSTTPGENKLTATLEGVPGSAVTFTATGT